MAQGNVLLVVKDPDARELATHLFQRAGIPFRRADSGEEALTAVEQRTPDLVLIDLTLRDMSGYELCHEIRERWGREPAIMLLTDDRPEPQDRIASLLIGADDVLSRPFHPDELLVRARRLLPPPEPPPGNIGLTTREAEVLRLLARGLKREAIAKTLFLSPKTVATHIQHILGKLGVHSAAEAVAAAYRARLLNGSDDTKH